MSTGCTRPRTPAIRARARGTPRWRSDAVLAGLRRLAATRSPRARADGAALLRSRAASDLRLQSRRGHALVRAGHAVLDRAVCDVLLGPGLRARTEHQSADGSRKPSRARSRRSTARALRLNGADDAARSAALIDAMAVRYGKPAGAERAERDAAYAAAMRRVAATVSGRVRRAGALRRRDAQPAPVEPVDARRQAAAGHRGTRRRARARVVAARADHAGACHFYIHAIEASETPERALPCAERLPRLMPGAGHVVHMPAHVYLRVGRYEDAARANIAAVEADNRYLAGRDAKAGIYPLFYAPHNLHFLWAAYLLSGQRAKALSAARALVARVDAGGRQSKRCARGIPARRRSSRRRDSATGHAVLAEPAPPADLAYYEGHVALRARAGVRGAGRLRRRPRGARQRSRDRRAR